MTQAKGAVMSRRRGFGIAFLVSAIPAAAVAILETTLSMRAFAPSFLELLYGANVHCAIACAALVIARLLLWRMRSPSFVPAALGMFVLAELSFTGSLWLVKSPWAPPLATRAGKLFAACAALAAIAAGILVILWLVRRFRRVRFSGRCAQWAGTAGGALFVCFLLCNAALVATHYARSGSTGAGGGHMRGGAAERDAAPDVFLVLVDALRFDRVSSNGYERPTSPALDAFFRECRVFANAYTPGNKTVPSIVSYFTGLYPESHGVVGPFAEFPRGAPTLAEQFRRHGYETAAFVGNMLVSAEHGFSRGFDSYSPRGMPWWRYHGRTGVEALVNYFYVPEDAASGERICGEFFSWLDAHPRGPRFVYLHFMEPHAPYDPPDGDYEAVAPGVARGPAWPPMFHDYAGEGSLEDWQSLAEPPAVEDADRLGMIAAYDGEIRAADRAVGKVFDELRKRGMYENAFIVFMNDHGEEFGDHGGWFHGHSIYDELTRCPLAYRPPGGLPEMDTAAGGIPEGGGLTAAGGTPAGGGRIIERPVSVLDFLMTLFELLEMDPLPHHQGLLIPELFELPPPAARAPVISSLPPQLYSCRLGPWKLVRRGDPDAPADMLFDLAADPLERNDLSLVLPDTLAMLRSALERTIRAHEELRLGSSNAAADPRLLERLRSLGYVK
ncbi:MAG: sulfatase [Chitinivibrionia bacterium]|nr:sulfatase [Chitinivibrionia bacterium]